MITNTNMVKVMVIVCSLQRQTFSLIMTVVINLCGYFFIYLARLDTTAREDFLLSYF